MSSLGIHVAKPLTFIAFNFILSAYVFLLLEIFHQQDINKEVKVLFKKNLLRLV